VSADWVERQLVARGINDARVLAAMRAVPRERFVRVEDRKRAYRDGALEIGHGQTISQPFIVALICSLCRLVGAERVLDVGTGSGYQAAVLDELAAEVLSLERIPELAGLARENLAATGHAGVEVRVADGSAGAPDRAPFDAIAVAASVERVPPALVEQLAGGGRLVLPVGDELVVVTPDGAVRAVAPVRFVPLVTGFPPA